MPMPTVDELERLIRIATHRMTLVQQAAQQAIDDLAIARDAVQCFVDRQHQGAPMAGQYEDLANGRALWDAIDAFNTRWASVLHAR